MSRTAVVRGRTFVDAPSARLVSPVLVGRHQELDLLIGAALAPPAVDYDVGQLDQQNRSSLGQQRIELPAHRQPGAAPATITNLVLSVSYDAGSPDRAPPPSGGTAFLTALAAPPHAG